MSSTRKAEDDTVFHQGRYASSAEFERGLIAYLVAKRCVIVESAADKELIWFLQYLSHQDGGLSAVAKDLMAKYPDRIQTVEMSEMKLKHDKICNAEQVKKIRGGLPEDVQRCFILKGECVNYLLYEIYAAPRYADNWTMQEELDKSKTHPTNYPANLFFKNCENVASKNLEIELKEICLDPKCNLTHKKPWYFPRLVETLREYKNEFVKQKNAGVVITALGAKVCEVLDYTFYSRGLTLMQGNARLGKSFAARAWCLQHPGMARFVEVPPSNDEASFFRALARGLGLGNFLQYKVAEIRERVEGVLLTGDLLLILDEGHRLWPQRNLRYGFPSRINWVMAMANHNVPICIIATPQFIEWQKAAEEKGRWNSAQLTGRVNHFELLPMDLELTDLISVAKAVLPEADSQVLKALAIYARSSSRYLAAIDSISKRARFIAMRDNRQSATTTDVRRAMQESVIPADTKLLRALQIGRKPKLHCERPSTALTVENETTTTLRPDGPAIFGSRRNSNVGAALTAT